jgi:hypothetical protein
MTDEFMTWWLQADNPGCQSKLVFYCYSTLAADIVVINAHQRGDMSHIEVTKMPPMFSQTVRVTSLNHNSARAWYFRNSVKEMSD